jgi:hypothetical protein
MRGRPLAAPGLTNVYPRGRSRRGSVLMKCPGRSGDPMRPVRRRRGGGEARRGCPSYWRDHSDFLHLHRPSTNHRLQLSIGAQDEERAAVAGELADGVSLALLARESNKSSDRSCDAGGWLPYLTASRGRLWRR